MKQFNNDFRAGFTIVELVVVMVFFVFITSLITSNLLNLQHQTSTNTEITKLVNDIKIQQIKSMMGDTDGALTSIEIGVHLDTDRYVLFRGSSYSQGDPSNIEIPLDPNINITNITLPGSNIIFDYGSGELVGYIPGMNTFTVQNVLGGQQKQVSINRFGVITDVN